MNTDLTWLIGEDPEAARLTLIYQSEEVTVLRADRLSWRNIGDGYPVPATVVLALIGGNGGTITINGFREDREDYYSLVALLHDGDDLVAGRYLDLEP